MIKSAKSIKALCAVLLLAAGSLKADKKTAIEKDIFGARVFIENRGQFNRVLPSGGDVKFAYENGLEHIYFTPTGLSYKLIKKFPMTHRLWEEIEHGKNVSPKKDEVYFVNMKWLGANENINIVESEKQNHYFTYGGPEYNSSSFKKITYKNVYRNIDIEYFFPEDKEDGIKYNVILHPGANISDIKIEYSGDVSKVVNRNGEIVVKTPVENITEHALKCYYEGGEPVQIEYQVSGNVISFHAPEALSARKTLVIDPYVTLLTQMTSNQTGYDVDYDYSGNMFVYGGFQQVKVSKYDPLGNLVWTFNGSLPAVPWQSGGDIDCVGNFIVNKITGKTYVGTGFEFNGARVIRLDQFGVYDNFVTTPIATQREIWDMGFHCGTGKVYGLGGGTFGNTNAGLIDQVTATVQAANFTGLAGSSQDIASNAIDDNGNIFVYFTGPSVNNKIMLVNPSFNGNIWFVPSGFNNFSEAVNKQSYPGAGLPFATSNGFNILAVNNNYLFGYNGSQVIAYNKLTGAQIANVVIPGLTQMQQGGIAVDDCNNLYLGGNGNIKVYSFNGVSFTALAPIPLGVNTPNQYVFDIRLNKYSNTLFVSGSGFAGTYNATQICAAANNMSLTASCQGNNNGTGVVTLSTGIANPTVNYVWSLNGNTVAATYSTGALTNTVTGLGNGTYVVQCQINPPCGPVQVNTIVINCCNAFNVVPTVTQVGCTYTVNSVSISVAGGGTVSPTITWSPTPQTIAGNSLSASGLPAGTTTISVSYGQGCATIVTVNINPTPPPLTFTINNLTGSYSITCTNPTINLQAVTNYTFGAVNYSWTSISFTANTTTVGISQPNTLTVTVTDPGTGCTTSQTVAVGINTIAPTNTVNPTSQVVTCNSGSPVTFTGTCTNLTVNIQHDWYSPLNPPPGAPIATSNNTITIFDATPFGPGVYTLVTTNLVNGCKTSKTITVTTLSSWPTFNVASPTNFSVGCSPLNQTTISIINPISTQTPPATCSYTFLPPTFTGAVTPSVVLGNNTSTTTTIPGSWTVIVQDNSNFCRTQIVVPVIQNTVAPNVSANVLTQTLTCYNPTVLATGTSSTPNTGITWLLPISPPNYSQPTVVIGTNTTGPNTSTTSLNYASFTVVATNSLNACQSTSVVIFNQNFKPPVSQPTISIATATAIYCTAATNPVVLTTGSSTTTSNGGPTAFPVPLLWAGPSPQATVTGASSYSCYVPGVYSLTIMDNYNGCTTTNTINVLDKTQPPVIATPADTGTLDCGANSATLLTTITPSTSGLMYWYYGYPVGAAFSPTAAIKFDQNPLLSGTSSNTVTVSMPGVYNYVVSNTLTGCRAFGIFTVVNGGITADFTPDVTYGYAPLNVNFTNNSATSLGTGSITSIWSFGNGTSQTYSSIAGASTTYTSAGTYTVLLLVQKGTCIDTTYHVVKVDLPSALDVPNVFTPNGDGINDIFFLKATNLTEIYLLIHDRWGNKVYESTSTTGNIAWDGKNLQGKNCSDGTFFYVIKAKGKDAQEYTKKGNVSLFR